MFNYYPWLLTVQTVRERTIPPVNITAWQCEYVHSLCNEHFIILSAYITLQTSLESSRQSDI